MNPENDVLSCGTSAGSFPAEHKRRGAHSSDGFLFWLFRARPVRAVVLGFLGSFACSTHADASAVAAGGYNSLFLKSDGTLWGAGYRYGASPVQVSSGVTIIAQGESHSLFVKSDGTLWAMGYNYSGELGDGTTTLRYLPVQVASGVRAVAVGQSHSLFVKIDGTLWAMGARRF